MQRGQRLFNCIAFFLYLNPPHTYLVKSQSATSCLQFSSPRHLTRLLFLSAEGVTGVVSVRSIGRHAMLVSSVWVDWMMSLARMKRLLLIVPVEHCQVSWSPRRGSHSLVQMGSVAGREQACETAFIPWLLVGFTELGLYESRHSF
jgi:hypothetical protein